MSRLLNEFDDIFGSTEDFGEFPFKIRIPTKVDPIAARMRPIPERYQAAADAEIDRLLSMGVIEPNSDKSIFSWTKILNIKNRR